MTAARRRLIYLWCLPVGVLVVALVWFAQRHQVPEVRYSYPFLEGYLVVAWIVLRVRGSAVEAIERATFWFLAVFWLLTMTIRLSAAADADAAWRSLSPSVFMGLTILVVMAYLWFDTTSALRNSVLLPAASTVIGLVYFVPRPGIEHAILIDFIRYEVYLSITVAFVYALARSKDALLQSRLDAQRMRALAYRDPLTDLDNRRQALDVLTELAARRPARSAGVVILDIDEFKQINDRHGHDAGDAVLVQLGAILRRVAGHAPAVARWGGEEFLIVLDADARAAREVAETVRQAVTEHDFADGIAATVSAGVSQLGPAGDVAVTLRNADRALYRAKNEGRNTVRSLVA